MSESDSSEGASPPQGGTPENEVLVVSSKLKQYIRARAGMNTSDRVLGVISDQLRGVLDQAVAAAARDKRKTLMERDVLSLVEPLRSATAGEEADEKDDGDVLVVISKVKKYVKSSSGMNTSDAVIPVVSSHLKKLARDAIRSAGEDGRKTVLERDFARSPAG